MTGIDVLLQARQWEFEAEFTFDSALNTVNFIRLGTFEIDTLGKSPEEVLEILEALRTLKRNNVI
jgi:hypothetical protein